MFHSSSTFRRHDKERSCAIFRLRSCESPMLPKPRFGQLSPIAASKLKEQAIRRRRSGADPEARDAADSFSPCSGALRGRRPKMPVRSQEPLCGSLEKHERTVCDDKGRREEQEPRENRSVAKGIR